MYSPLLNTFVIFNNAYFFTIKYFAAHELCVLLYYPSSVFYYACTTLHHVSCQALSRKVNIATHDKLYHMSKLYTNFYYHSSCVMSTSCTNYY